MRALGGIALTKSRAAFLAASSRFGFTSSAIMLLLVSMAITTAARFTGSGIAAIGRAMASTSSRTAPR